MILTTHHSFLLYRREVQTAENINPLFDRHIHQNHTYKNISDVENISENLYFGGDLDEIRLLVSQGKLNNSNIKFSFLPSS